MRTCVWGSYMADATGQPLDKIEEDTDRDFFMTPEEAMEYGIIDEVPLLHQPSLPALMPAHHTRAQSGASCMRMRVVVSEVWQAMSGVGVRD